MTGGALGRDILKESHLCSLEVRLTTSHTTYIWEVLQAQLV